MTLWYNLKSGIVISPAFLRIAFLGFFSTFFFSVMGFELRASYLLGRHCNLPL
jgi:hypothetical protein